MVARPAPSCVLSMFKRSLIQGSFQSSFKGFGFQGFGSGGFGVSVFRGLV